MTTDLPDALDPSQGEDSAPDIDSKTSRKREATRLQQLGLRISQLTSDQRDALQLTETVTKAIDDYLRFPSREAKRRQLQYVGKVMRNTDTTAIEAALATLEGQSAEAKYQLHQSEQWRDRLIAEPAALAEFIDAYPMVDRQTLRRTLDKARKAHLKSHDTKSDPQAKRFSRELFRLLRDAMDSAQHQND